jgi:acetyl esterase/lipase
MSSSPNYINSVLKMIRAREMVQRQFLNPPRGATSFNPKKVKKSLHPESWEVEGNQILTIHGNPPSQIHVIFLPGGAYLMEATSFHRQFAEKLALKYGLSVSLVNYPKAPEHTYNRTHAVLQSIYLQLQEKYTNQNFRLLGDSAGGGLALAFLQSLRDLQTDSLPDKTVLISPWLDLSLNHPQILDYIERDLILPLDGLKHAAKLYAGGAKLDHPQLSPLSGDLSGLGDIQLLYGTEELFYPDCQALIEKVQDASGTTIEWQVGENMIHAWPIFPFPQSRTAIADIANFLLTV